MMHGSVSQFKLAVLEQLSEASLNELELALLGKALENPQECAPKVVDILTKAMSRL
jgi:hypothetical protein